jgi:molybdopterin-containing oxidoreductase family iron-sulfur binding subunit
MMVGLNAYSLYKGFIIQSVTLEAGGEHEFACVQGQKH